MSSETRPRLAGASKRETVCDRDEGDSLVLSNGLSQIGFEVTAYRRPVEDSIPVCGWWKRQISYILSELLQARLI